MRLDLALVAQGHSRSRNRAAALISDGAVSVNGKVCTKSSLHVAEGDVITIELADSTAEFASRASYKLLRTLEAITPKHLETQGALVLDVGASTGGFTDVALRQGAQHVVALDVGHDQLVSSLREDPRVTVIEGYNARLLSAHDLPYTPDLVVCDVSFISLTLLLPALSGVSGSDTQLLLMVKPQFEVGKNNLGAGGVVRDPALHVQAITKVVNHGLQAGLFPRAIIPSALPGPHGNREFFVWFTKIPVQSAALSQAVCDNGAVVNNQLANSLEPESDQQRIDEAISHAVAFGHNDEQPTGKSQEASVSVPRATDVPATEVFWI